MHILIPVGIVALLLLIWLNRAKRVDASEIGKVESIASEGVPVLFVSRGKLFLRRPGENPDEVASPHVQAVVDRMEKSRQLHGWKEGTTFGVSASGGMRSGVKSNVELQASSAAFLSNDEVIYCLKDESVGGLFSQNLSNGEEKRLLHKQNLLLEDIAISPDREKLLCSAKSKNGSANIASVNVDGTDFVEVTAGDTVDTNPSWIPGEPDSILYQSSGIARDEHGFVVAQGSASIQMLNIASGDLEVVREDEAYDYLQPKVGLDGALYFIRRPYEAPNYGAQSFLVDTLLFPFRLLRAIFHYLNFFSLMYSRKPLSSASGPGVEADLKELLVQGKRFDAEQALRAGPKLNGVPSLVPANWQLIRRSTRGEETIIARHVAAFDISPSGTILFSNGFGVFAVSGPNSATVVFMGKLIGDIAAGEDSYQGGRVVEKSKLLGIE